MSDFEAGADAVKELATLAKYPVKKLTDFAYNAIGIPLENLIGLTLGNLFWWGNERIRLFYAKNILLKYAEVAEDITNKLTARNVKLEEIRTLYEKYGIPLLTNAIYEHDDDLQKLWNNLITNALDPNFKEDIKMAYIDILKSLTPLDARILQDIYCQLKKRIEKKLREKQYSDKIFTELFGESTEEKSELDQDDYIVYFLDNIYFKESDIRKRLNIYSVDYERSIYNLFRLGCLTPFNKIVDILEVDTKEENVVVPGLVDKASRNMGHEEVIMTILGYELVEALSDKTEK